MKKVLILLLACLFAVWNLGANAEFAIRGGVQFGMSLEEVQKTETDNGCKGITPWNDAVWNWYGGGGDLTELCVRVESLAGIRHEYDDSQINYYFRDDSLFAIKYSFGTYYSSAKITAIYNDLYDVLCAKYGNPSEKSQIIDTPIAENFSAWDTEEYAHEFVYAMATDSGSVFIDIAIESGYDVGYRLYVGYRFVPAEELQALQSAYEARDAERLEAMFRDL